MRVRSTRGRSAGCAAAAPPAASRIPISQSFQRLSDSLSSRSAASASVAAFRSTARDFR